MATMNGMKFVSNAVEELVYYKRKIEGSESYEDAENNARFMIGYMGCMTTVLSTMIYEENDEFTEDFDAIIDNWMWKMYQELINKAYETKQPHEKIAKLFKLRDDHSHFC